MTNRALSLNHASPDRSGRSWTVMVLVAAALVLIPLAIVVGAHLSPDDEVWSHIREHVLGRVTVNTVWLVAGVVLITSMLGTGLAWLTAACEFPGRRFFDWALLLPMAMPGYVVGFVMIGLFEFAGPIQSLLRGMFDTEVAFPEIRSRGGVILVLSLVLYPYVYLLARNAFLTQGRHLLEVARSLGCRPARGFFRVALPMARPWIVAGLLLVVMETLADFGTVAAFNYDTYTTAIYKAWFDLFSIQSALQLASVLIVPVLLLLWFNERIGGRKRFETIGPANGPGRLQLTGWQAVAATLFVAIVWFAAFALPFAQLLIWAAGHLTTDLDMRFLRYVANSLLLASSGAATVCLLATLIAYAARQRPDALTRGAARVATLGYALPGTVLAVGIFVPLAGLSRVLNEMTGAQLLLQTTVITMLLAYTVRFLAVAMQPVQTHLLRVTPNIDAASRILGVSGLRMLSRVHLPIVKGGLLTAFALVFVDIMKEMPITLMTRPAGWDTLAVRVFEMTAEGHWQRAALPAVAIVATGLVPVLLIIWRSADAPRR
ncbi:MAG: iron ABC transporter permease [Gammaproteobacteria bacterium]